MPSLPPVIFTPPSGGSPPAAAPVIFTPPGSGGAPAAPPVIFTGTGGPRGPLRIGTGVVSLDNIGGVGSGFTLAANGDLFVDSPDTLTELSMIDTGLFGSIPVVNSLTALTVLELFIPNQLTPPNLNGLVNLSHLQIDHGSSAPDITGLSNLASLALNGSTYTTPPSIAGLTSLNYFEFSNSNFSNGAIQLFWTALLALVQAGGQSGGIFRMVDLSSPPTNSARTTLASTYGWTFEF